jgi:hypothetical protein
MKHILSLIVGTLLVLGFAAPSYAINCTGVTYSELMSRLEDVGFPMILLKKAHETDLRAQGDFTECPPNKRDHETAMIYSWYVIDPPYAEEVAFTFFEFPSIAVRDATLAKLRTADADALNNSDNDVFYYMHPGGKKAFRIKRSRSIPIE